jgi:predicted secreted protein
MKKILLFFLVLALSLSLVGCGNKANQNINSDQPQAPIIEGQPETGTTIDLTTKNNQTVTTTPGDILYVKLDGPANKGYQWSLVSPLSGDFLMLKDHKVVGLTDAKILNGKFTDEWWLKVEKTGDFDLKFDYAKINKRTEKFFKVRIVSQ